MSGNDEIEPPGIGLSWLWMLPDSHPFFWPAVKHDLRYDLRQAGMLSDETSSRADQAFYKDCLAVAASDLTLKLEAEVFYEIVKIVGAFRWPTPETDPSKRGTSLAQAIDKLRKLKSANQTFEGSPGESV